MAARRSDFLDAPPVIVEYRDCLRVQYDAPLLVRLCVLLAKLASVRVCVEGPADGGNTIFE